MDKLRFLLLPLLALTFVPFSMAQDSDEDVEEVVVTGSRITNPNIVSTSQVQVVTAEDIDNRGAVRIEEVLNDLPQLSPGQIAQTANGSNGTATANLRNQGCSRTLVLINGKRMAPGTTNGGSCADCEHIAGEMVKQFAKERPLSSEIVEKLGKDLSSELHGGLPAL